MRKSTTSVSVAWSVCFPLLLSLSPSLRLTCPSDRTCESVRRWRMTRQSPCQPERLEVRLQEPARESVGRSFCLISRLPSTVHWIRILAFAPVNERRGGKE